MSNNDAMNCTGKCKQCRYYLNGYCRHFWIRVNPHPQATEGKATCKTCKYKGAKINIMSNVPLYQCRCRSKAVADYEQACYNYININQKTLL